MGTDAVELAARRLAALDTEHLLLPVLVQLVVIVGSARAFGALARRVGQPSVVGEIVAGLVLGPSLFGWLFPDLFALLFRPQLSGVDQPIVDAMLPKVFTVIAQLGLIFLLFLVGLEFEGGHVRAHGRAVGLVSVAGFVLPFALGVALTPVVHPYLEPHPAAGPVPSVGVALFLGLTLAVTAIPVLGRILLEVGIIRTRVGAVTLAAAGISDALGWVLLASVAAAVKAHFDPLQTLRMVGQSAAFVLVMLFVVRPILMRYFAWSLRVNGGKLSPTALAVLFVGLFLSAIATNWIGIFAVFGAFLYGAILAEQEQLRQAAATRLHDVVSGFFVPVFFTYTGLRTDITSLHGATLWGIAAVVIIAAVVGKLAGCGLAARVSGFRWKEAFIIGAMMNARGLMALVAINLGYELGVVPRSLFCILVLMALATTMLTTPLLLWLHRGTEIEEPIRKSRFLSTQREGLPSEPQAPATADSEGR